MSLKTNTRQNIQGRRKLLGHTETAQPLWPLGHGSKLSCLPSWHHGRSRCLGRAGEQAAGGSHWAPHSSGRGSILGARGPLRPVRLDTQGKLEARSGPARLLTRRTIPSGPDCTDAAPVEGRQPETVCQALSALGPGCRRKGWAEPDKDLWEGGKTDRGRQSQSQVQRKTEREGRDTEPGCAALTM